jgi:hypothetical protein
MAEGLIPSTYVLGSVGFQTDMSSQARGLTHYERLENVVFEVSGAFRKVGGNTRINATAIASAPSITGMYDYWRAGTSGTFAQKHVVMTSNQKIYKDDMDGTYDDITGAASITASAIPIFSQARDTLLILDDKNDTPLKWTQTGDVATLGGSPPAGRGSIFHANRPWIWGANANPSRLYYGSSTDIEDWSGGDTGSIDLDPDDGDRIIGVCVYKSRLIIFKGPNKGSIHVIAGTAPTGTDAFARTRMVNGIALQTHNSIIPVMDDIWFMSQYGVHSLAATEAYGDFQGAYLTRFLRSYFRSAINRAGLARVWGINYDEKGCGLWVIAGAGSATNNRTFGLSYARIQEEGLKPFEWTRGGASAGIRINPTSALREVVFGGTATGFVTLEDQPSRSLASGAAYSLRATTPKMFFAEQDENGTARPYGVGTPSRLALRSVSTGDWDVTISVQRDTIGSTLHRFNQGADLTTIAGFILGTSALGDTLGGGATTGGPQISFNTELGGTCRTVQFDITQGGLDQDAHLNELVLDWTPEAFSTASNVETTDQ